MRHLLIVLAIISFTSCSIKTPKNEWQYKSANAFSSYTKNFLSDNNALAQNDLQRAIKHAKQSADLTQLAKVYLGECALHISVGEDTKCHRYKNISELLDNKELDAYYDFITLAFKKNTIGNLPQHYKKFAIHLKNSEYTKANENIFAMSKESSSLLAGALIKNHIDEKTRNHLIQTASFHGYKKAVLFYLHEKSKTLQNEKSIQDIEKKIAILRSH